MDSDRRQSVRVPVKLPCRWQIIAKHSNREDVIKQLSLPRCFTQAGELNHLSEELAHTLHRIEDETVSAALALLDQKLDLVAGQNFSHHTPPMQQICLSVDGLAVTSETAVPVGTTMAVHLVLDNNFPLIQVGEVTRCNNKDNQHVIGIKLNHMQDYDARRLARFVMRLPSASN